MVNGVMGLILTSKWDDSSFQASVFLFFPLFSYWCMLTADPCLSRDYFLMGLLLIRTDRVRYVLINGTLTQNDALEIGFWNRSYGIVCCLVRGTKATTPRSVAPCVATR